jgi:hypothetical protein
LSFEPTSERLFQDILDPISLIDEFTSEMDLEKFRASPMAVAAVERSSRSSVKLPYASGATPNGSVPTSRGVIFEELETSFVTHMNGST